VKEEVSVPASSRFPFAPFTLISSYGPIVDQRHPMEANIKTPEGRLYQAAFEKKYKELVKTCVNTEGGNLEKFESLTSIGTNGTVEDIKIYWNGAAAICLYNKLHQFQLKKTKAFPRPPQAPYWIRLDFAATEFASKASK
jgi:hypothetical protein